MPELPPFETAVGRFVELIASHGYPTSVTWVFRDDLWRKSRTRAFVRWPLSSDTLELSVKVYGEGRSRGIVGLQGLAQRGDTVLATVWYPKYQDEEVQGWSENLSLSIADPLATASRLPRLLWPLLRLIPAFRRYQRNEFVVGTRKWAAAEPGAPLAGY